MDKEVLEQHILNFNTMCADLDDGAFLRLTIKSASGRTFAIDIERDAKITAASLTKTETLEIKL